MDWAFWQVLFFYPTEISGLFCKQGMQKQSSFLDRDKDLISVFCSHEYDL